MILVLYQEATAGYQRRAGCYRNQNSPGVPGTPEGDDAFGASLVSGNYGRSGRDDLVVGVPREDVGSVQDAGMVKVIYGRASGLSGINAQGWTQSSAGVKGTAESGDWFGWSLAPSETPVERVGRANHGWPRPAGAHRTADESQARALTRLSRASRRTWPAPRRRSSRGVAGHPETPLHRSRPQRPRRRAPRPRPP